MVSSFNGKPEQNLAVCAVLAEVYDSIHSGRELLGKTYSKYVGQDDEVATDQQCCRQSIRSSLQDDTFIKGEVFCSTLVQTSMTDKCLYALEWLFVAANKTPEVVDLVSETDDGSVSRLRHGLPDSTDLFIPRLGQVKVVWGRDCFFVTLLQSILCGGEESIELDIVVVRPSDEIQRALNEKGATNYSTISRELTQRLAAVWANDTSLVNIETIIRGLQGSWQPTSIQGVVITKTEMTIHGCDGVEMTTGWEDARVLVQINFAVLAHHDQVHHTRLGMFISTFLTETSFRTGCTANTWTMMTAVENTRTALRAGDPVTGSSTWHAALAVRATRRTLLVGTWSAWLRTWSTTVRVLALDFAWLVAKAAVGSIVTRLGTTVRAVHKVAAAWLTAGAMVSFHDTAFFPVLTTLAGLLADMATCQRIAALLIARVPVAVHVLTAFDLDFMTAPRNRAGDNFMTNDLILFMVEPAWKRCLDVTARQLNSNVFDDRHTFRWTYLAALVRTCV
jgi:hypothetical protein